MQKSNNIILNITENEKSYIRRKIVCILKRWQYRNSLLAVLTKILDQVVKGLEKSQKSFLWVNSTLKRKHETTYKDYKDSGLKYIDIPYKIVYLHGSWIKNDCFHEWKLIAMLFASKLKFHCNSFLKKFSLKKL